MHNNHPEPGFGRNGKTHDENDEKAKTDKEEALRKERELGGLLNVKNEGKLQKAVDDVPSLSKFDYKPTSEEAKKE